MKLTHALPLLTVKKTKTKMLRMVSLVGQLPFSHLSAIQFENAKRPVLVQVSSLKSLKHTSYVELPTRHNVTFHRQQNIQEEESDLFEVQIYESNWYLQTHTHTVSLSLTQDILQHGLQVSWSLFWSYKKISNKEHHFIIIIKFYFNFFIYRVLRIWNILL